MHWYPRYVPVDGQRARAVSEMHELRSRGVSVQPIEIRGRTIARSFWGRHWCEHLESFSEYAARLAHGRAYVRNGSICHLAVDVGSVDAMVIGSALYRVAIRIRRLPEPAWTAIRSACAGRIGTLSELHEGLLPDRVVAAIVTPDAGLFPQPGEIVPSCECADRAPMCKHAAAVLSGVGSRLDDSPELLFRLRGVDEKELIADGVAPASARATPDASAGGNGKPTVGVDPGSGNAATAPYWSGATSNATEPGAFSNAPARGAPTPADPAPAPRRVKKTLTYRPSTPIASLPLALPADIGDEAAGFQPTGELVGELRERCGCSVTEFADLIQVTAPTVRRWETTSGPLSLHARPWEALRALHLEIRKHEG